MWLLQIGGDKNRYDFPETSLISAEERGDNQVVILLPMLSFHSGQPDLYI